MSYAARLREGAGQIQIDGTPSQVGPSPDELYAAASEIDRLRGPFRNADAKDWEHLFRMLPESGHGKFWKAVLAEMKIALSV